MYLKHPPYFLHNQKWKDYWLKTNPVKHDCTVLVVDHEGVKLQANVYHYPWYFGQNYLYIPKGPFLDYEGEKPDFEIVEKVFRDFLNKLMNLAGKNNSSYVKIDLEDVFGGFLELFDVDSSSKYIQKCIPDYRVVVSNKTIQYLGTMTIDLDSIKSKPDGIKNITKPSSLESFFNENQDFWFKTNQNVRRYTKKAIHQGWQISIVKTDQDFEDFWQVYKFTSNRHGFATHEKETFKMLFDQEFSRMIILRDADGKVQCGWMGIVLDDTITNLHGGNTPESFKKYGQYLTHILAIYMGICEGCKYYDLGGYDLTKGFGKFKDGYRGYVRSFLGPIDILTKKNKYYFTNGMIDLVKKIKK